MKKLCLITAVMMISSTVIAQDLSRLFNLRGYWKFSIGDHKEWATPAYNDTDWEEIHVPRRWELEGFNGYDGYAWYRKTFDGKVLENEKVVYLRLGYIDDVDEVYINGRKVGFSGGFPPDYYTAYHAERLYRIPHHVLNYDGDNLISVRIFDNGGEGGIYTGNVGLYVPTREFREALFLEGVWKIKVSDREEYADPGYDDSGWDLIMVPSNWKSIGIDDLDDFAWYRKKFVIPAGTGTTGMTMVCGRIDDFDEVFINGTKVGATKDGKRFGLSRSFRELRVYEVPDGVLKEGENTIAVRVEDIGDNGGIYKGPVVLIPDQYVTRLVRNSYFWR